MTDLGTRLRTHRQRRRLTLTRLGAAVGAAPSYLSMIENGRVANPPSAALLDRLESALGIDDHALRDAAAWQSTPAPVRAALTRFADDAERGRRLAAWLKLQTGKHRGHGGRDLDRLYRSGQLSKRINAVLAPGSVATETQAETEHAETSAPTTPIDVSASHTTPDRANNREGELGPSVLLRHAAKVPLINQVAAGLPATFTDLDFPAGVADDYLAVPGLDDPDAFATRVHGESMEPDFVQGDIVVFSPAADVTDGCDAFARLEPEHEVTFKRVYFDQPAGAIRLQPLNPAYAPRIVQREHVAGLYRAVWRFAKL